MTLAIVGCPLCNWKAQAHGYARSGLVRDHFRFSHPEVEAEIRAFEAEWRERRKALRDKYGKDFYLAS